jgi:NADPH-dependent 7-cyano-7-deazaguanine reductase QueF-like protein
MGQGSCASSAIWLLTYMDCPAELAGGMTMLDAIKRNKTLKQRIDGFMDDTSLFSNISNNRQNCNDIKLLTAAFKNDLHAHGKNFWKHWEVSWNYLNIFTMLNVGNLMIKALQSQQQSKSNV